MLATRLSGVAAIAALVTLAACDGTPEPIAPGPSSAQSPSLGKQGSGGATGAVYTVTNIAGPNAVLAFPRHHDGRLGAPVAYPTGGSGAGAGLGSQGAVVLTRDGRWLLAVNAGSDGVSAFRVEPHGLTLTDVEGSGGDFPVSIAVHGDLVYVLNAMGTANISGFRLSRHGDLEPLAGSTRPLSAAAAAPAQVSFSPGGDVLAVTEKATNRITTFVVGADGLATLAGSEPSATPTPFGFAFHPRGHLIVSEAAGGAAGASVVSSYAVGETGAVSPIMPSVSAGQTAACWVALARGGRIAYVTNTGSGTVSAFAVGSAGALTVLHAVAASTGPGSAPIDVAASRNGRFVYVLAAGVPAVQGYGIAKDGSLDGIGQASGIPATAAGLAAR